MATEKASGEKAAGSTRHVAGAGTDTRVDAPDTLQGSEDRENTDDTPVGDTVTTGSPAATSTGDDVQPGNRP
ncbi:hypothetical protein [Azospirillum sp. SYSU D00513]|uniref:hypothetical protein n=1 Tax=Azospirillum sp. SYSU D00513 TaxID=2812561 RepID=UPI001A960919|nr:hypothetical protein [Azospirillum sp. SYSU D00513]